MTPYVLTSCCVVVVACAVPDTIAYEVSSTVGEARGLCACDGVVGAEARVLQVTGDLRSGGDLAGMLDVDVSGDAFVNGDVSGHDVRVAGTLQMPVGSRRAITGNADISRGLAGNVDVRAACHCEPTRQWDIASRVSQAQIGNDNATIELDSTALLNVQSPTTLMLPCGRFYLDGITGAADIELVTTHAGGASLVIGGDVATEASLTIRASTGPLELVIAGNLIVAGNWNAGGETEAVRVLVGGGGTLDLGGRAEVGGLLYAPNVELVARDSLQVWGPMLVRRLTSEGDVIVHDAMESEAPVALCL